jgi:hypothetical protein
LPKRTQKKKKRSKKKKEFFFTVAEGIRLFSSREAVEKEAKRVSQVCSHPFLIAKVVGRVAIQEPIAIVATYS